MDEGQGRGIPAAHAGVRLSDRPQTPSRRRQVEGCSQSQGKVRSQNAGESRSSLSCEEHQHVDGPGYGWGWWTRWAQTRTGSSDGCANSRNFETPADDLSRCAWRIPIIILAECFGMFLLVLF